mgnify:CR=1 FL=1
MIKRRNGNGYSICYGCKKKGITFVVWDSFFYTYKGKVYCYDCLMEKFDKLLSIKFSTEKQLLDFYEWLGVSYEL